MRRDLAWLALIVVGLALVYGLFSLSDAARGGRPDSTGASPPLKVLCYVQTTDDRNKPTSLVCEDSLAYMRIGKASPVPAVPR